MVLTSMFSSFACSSTKPPKRDRAADPDAAPANLASDNSSLSIPAASLAATTSAANADAEEASPAAIGKLHSLVTIARGRSLPATRSRHSLTRGNISSLTAVLTTSSSAAKSAENSTDILVHSESSVTDSELTAGRFRSISRLPQYLIRAIFGCA